MLRNEGASHAENWRKSNLGRGGASPEAVRRERVWRTGSKGEMQALQAMRVYFILSVMGATEDLVIIGVTGVQESEWWSGSYFRVPVRADGGLG